MSKYMTNPRHYVTKRNKHCRKYMAKRTYHLT